MTGNLQTITLEEAEKIDIYLSTSWTGDKERCNAIRNRAIVIFMLDAGLRIGELVKLKKEDVWYRDEPVRALELNPEAAKNGIGRNIPLTSRLRQHIHNLHDLVWHNDSELCFDITARQIERIVKSASLMSIGRAIHPHVLRHTFATRLMRKTNLRTVQELLGHVRITSTQIYTHPNQQDKVTAIRAIEGVDVSGETPTCICQFPLEKDI